MTPCGSPYPCASPARRWWASGEEAVAEIAGYEARLTTIRVGSDAVALWQVHDLERYVDRRALLADEEGPEPPYWAHLWSGATVLADAVPGGHARAVELGCGLGLPGLTAARRGAGVTFVDRVPAPLAFVRASAAANGVGRAGLVVADFTRNVFGRPFDLVLLAEVLYDREAFAVVADAIASLLAPGGVALLADGRRIDTRGFYPELAARGFRIDTTAHRVAADGVVETIDLSTIRWAPR